MVGAVLITVCSGCGLIHFGRHNVPVSSGLVEENTDLRMEKKILKQELLLAYKEQQALRQVLENRQTGRSNDSQLGLQLHEANRELNDLRNNLSRLETERTRLRDSTEPMNGSEAVEQIAQLKTQLAISEGKAGKTIESYAQLKRENAQLREEVRRVRSTNAGLAQQVQSLSLHNEEVASALSQLNRELLAQTDARRRAEEQSDSYQTQIKLILDRKSSEASSLTTASQSSATTADELDASLRLAQSSEQAAPTAVLRTSPERIRQAGANAAEIRYYIVAAGDTLESISERYYGTSEEWRKIYAANQAQLWNGRSLMAGIKLIIPDI
jgi:DNA repair exonuclease SbcCD ATPase subunit